MKMFAKYQTFWANYLKIRIEMAPNVVWFWKIGTQRCDNHMRPFFEVIPKMICVGGSTRTKSCQKSFRASLGKFGQKSLTPPKICLFLHLCHSMFARWHGSKMNSGISAFVGEFQGLYEVHATNAKVTAITRRWVNTKERHQCSGTSSILLFVVIIFVLFPINLKVRHNGLRHAFDGAWPVVQTIHRFS